MVARGILVALVWSALLPLSAAAQGHPAPTAEVVKQLRRSHHDRDWWRITTDSGRYEVRVRAIDAQGLSGLTAARKTPPAPDWIPWSSIVRIDVRKTHELRSQITWTILGMSAGFIPLANGNANSSQPRTYMLGGAIAGSYLGRYLGARNVHERALYVAPLAARPAVAVDTASVARSELPPIAPADSIAAVTPRSISTTATASPAIKSACRRISTQSLLRITGDFGLFHGYASSVGPEGLGGLRVETRYASVPSPGSLTWDRIDRLEVHGGNSGKGAVRGAIGMGLLTGFLSIPIGALASDNSDASMWGIVAGCAGIGAGIGSVFGGAIGATTSSWHSVYQRW